MLKVPYSEIVYYTGTICICFFLGCSSEKVDPSLQIRAIATDLTSQVRNVMADPTRFPVAGMPGVETFLADTSGAKHFLHVILSVQNVSADSVRADLSKCYIEADGDKYFAEACGFPSVNDSTGQVEDHQLMGFLVSLYLHANQKLHMKLIYAIPKETKKAHFIVPGRDPIDIETLPQVRHIESQDSPKRHDE